MKKKENNTEIRNKANDQNLNLKIRQAYVD